MTQAELADLVGLASHSHVSYLEADKSAPSLEVVISIAGVLGVSIDYLLRDELPIDSPVRPQISTPVSRSLIVNFGQRLRTLRKQRGLSQVNLAEKLRGFSRPFITMVESGQKEPSIAFVLACADVFDMSIDELIGAALPEV